MLLLGDCLERLKELGDSSVDSVVTDPPYGLSFMGKKWDYSVPSQEIFKEILRVLKPGGHALIACGTRTQHRMAVNIEDAGFEIRDVITWLYGSGFPKSLDISKAIDKAAGAERDVIGKVTHHDIRNGSLVGKTGLVETNITAPSTDAAKKYQGWGTALKPACEFWTLARKPLEEKTVAANVLKHGTGGINIDATRVGTSEIKEVTSNRNGGIWHSEGEKSTRHNGSGTSNALGRFPANLILDEEAGRLLDIQTASEASRFFYCAKASKSERGQGNVHPTVKPIKLMEYLIKLITPVGGLVLDPFMGSGTTGVAATRLGFDFIGIELSPEYLEIATKRIAV